MSMDSFWAWQAAQGHKVKKTDSTCWVQFGPFVYQAFPYHWVITPDAEETLDLLRSNRALALRYSAPPDSGEGLLSYHVVYERGDYSEKDLPKKARHDVKRGLSVSCVERIPLSRLAAEGWDLRRHTLRRQARDGAETQAWWMRLCLSAEGLPGFEAWGAIVQGKLAAALLAYADDDWYSILYQQSLTEYLRFGVNNALAYVVTRDVLSRPEPRRVFYGLHSLDAPPSVDEFKFRMGYTAKPVRQRVEFHPLLRPFVNAGSHGMLRLAHRVLRGSSTIAKAEGMFRFYLQGKLPVSEQDIPNALRANFAAGIP